VKSVLIHPSYGTPVAQYAAIAQCETLVWELGDNFQKQTYRNRMNIATSTGVLRLSIPIIHKKNKEGHQRSEDVQIENKFPWQRDHWRSLKIAYQTSPYFEYYEDTFEPLYTTVYEKLIDFQMALHDIIMECLQLEVETTINRDFEKETVHTDYRNLVLAKKKPKVTLPDYHQLFADNHDYLPNLTVLDLLFNEGTNALTYLEKVAFIG